MNPFQKLTKTVASFTPLTADEVKAIHDIAKLHVFKKGEFFTREGEICEHVGFVSKGIFRVYHLHEGKEVTNYFNAEFRNPFVSSFSSFLRAQPSKESVIAVEDAEVVMIAKKTLFNLYRKYHAIERLGRLMAEYNYLLALDRIESLQYRSATQRYEDFLKTYPGLINSILTTTSHPTWVSHLNPLAAFARIYPIDNFLPYINAKLIWGKYVWAWEKIMSYMKHGVNCVVLTHKTRKLSQQYTVN